jgi:hypothetical protein
MILGNYVVEYRKEGTRREYYLWLTCDNYMENDGIHEDDNETEYLDNTGAQCKRAAIEDGWILDFKNYTAICPKCTKKSNPS